MESHVPFGRKPLQMMPSYYLAPVSYYSRLLRTEGASIDIDEAYQKQSWRTRCIIDSPNGTLTLSIPVEKMAHGTAMRDVRISDHGNWRHQHWNALCSSYRQSPFFDYYADEFAPFYEKRWEFLVDYNQALQQLVLDLMDIRHMQSMPSEPISSEYYQVFAHRHGFLPDLSIVDLLFNMGPESILYL